MSESVITSGWDSAKKAIAEGSKGYSADFRFSEEPKLVKFLEDAPFAVYKQHWLQEITSGKRSFTCHGEDACPLCKKGHSPDTKIAFTVVNFDEAEPTRQMLVVGPRLAGQFEKFNDDPKTGPLNRDDRYWALSSSGKGNKKSYSIVPVKTRDLADDYDITPDEAEAALDEMEPLDTSAVYMESVADLRKIASEHL